MRANRSRAAYDARIRPYGDRDAPFMPAACGVCRHFIVPRSAPACAWRVARPQPDPCRTLPARMIGWHRLERLLASIPDSNDDFGIV
jgi:hypothetical protein